MRTIRPYIWSDLDTDQPAMSYRLVRNDIHRFVERRVKCCWWSQRLNNFELLEVQSTASYQLEKIGNFTK